jgi:DNA-binding transcriptional ArsR family regulator
MSKTPQSNLGDLVPKALEAAETLKALAHETRLLAVCFIGDGERTVQELEGFLGTTQSNVSQHLAKLKAAGVLASRKDGKLVFYRVKDPGMFRLVEALQSIYCPPAENGTTGAAGTAGTLKASASGATAAAGGRPQAASSGAARGAGRGNR